MSSLTAFYTSRWTRALLTVSLLGLDSVKVDPRRVGEAMASAQPLPIAVALFLLIPFLYLKAARWHLLLRRPGSMLPSAMRCVPWSAAWGWRSSLRLGWVK